MKIWGTARVVENDPELNARLFPEGYKARVEAVILFTVEAWDANCPQHIPHMLFAEDVAPVVDAAQIPHRPARSRECAPARRPFARS